MSILITLGIITLLVLNYLFVLIVFLGSGIQTKRDFWLALCPFGFIIALLVEFYK